MSGTENSRTALGVVVACTIGNMLCMTTTVSAVFGVFLVPIAEDFGWPRAQVTSVLGLIAIINAFAYPLVGRAIDRFGARPILLAGNVLLAASVASISLAHATVASFYGHFVLVGLAGSIPCTAMFSKVVSGWFDKKRGLMLGISAGVGNGVGATIMPIIAAASLAALGWQTSYALIGAIIFVVGFPLQWFLLREPAPVAASINAPAPQLEGHTLVEALRTPAFWLILATLGLGSGCLTAVFSHVIPVLTDRGFDLATAASVMSTLALVTSAAQILSGSLLDRFASPRVVAPAFAIATAGLWLLEHRDGATLLVAGAMLGIGLGAVFGALPLFISRYFGLRSYGTIGGVIYAIVMLAQGGTPVAMDWMFDSYGSYAPSILLIEACLLGISALMLVLPPFGARRVAHEDVAGLAHVGL
ncbi:MFS transporter [Sphingomonas sp. BK069]|uniref:MFS transporter n=1 Tax=Sphingomonas sp. BK069 TaxID=2586979 RepID=UPI0016179A21|nr:MFS transporter [Sphingomonas sp. BK069]MBB3349899.1 MFS family permease [Sphingomonas sp. BK069]